MKYIPIAIAFFATLIFQMSCTEKKVDFSTEVKPIINNRCIACHGGVKRNGGFSLLFREDALDSTESGKFGIVPGDPSSSEMIRRLTSKDPEVRMPYHEDPLPEEEIEILTKWVKQGAVWGDHWAYVAPVKPSPPEYSDDAFVQNEIDAFVLHRLQQEGLSPSSPASKEVLLRRVCLDLIGLAPDPVAARAFLRPHHPVSFEHVVDSLLSMPQFGEKWASWWLDMARYSDTKGYERDPSRRIWRYRDWVINALNQDMPFDQFTIEQLAGDLLEDPTDEQYIATAFHRNTMNNDEGGTEDEEFRVAAVIDRVNTTMEVWQSTTFSCVQCHSHPYDPFRHEEYYRLMAFFNNTRDEDLTGEYPLLREYSDDEVQEMERIKQWVATHDSEIRGERVEHFLKLFEPKYNPHDCDQFINGELIDTKWLGIRHGGSTRLANVDLTGKTQMILSYWTSVNGGTLEIRTNSLSGDVIGTRRLPNTNGEPTVINFALTPVEGSVDLYFILRNPTLSPDRSVCAIEWFTFQPTLPGSGEEGFASIEESFFKLANSNADGTPVMVENTSAQYRTTRIFERGNWLVTGEPVKPGTPRHFDPMPENFPDNRLGLAKWLVAEENPLTARTVVNRFWEQLFGMGFVETLEDFGTQGATPSHPELLDWLSVTFRDDLNWSMKKLLKMMVMSSAYQQDSRVNETLYERDPDNRLLARGPRVRLSAEQIRDVTLQASGLLSVKMFGPSVMPPQPEGVWQTVYSNEKWEVSEGDDKYRRAVYTFIKRTSPYPSFMMFDASSREVCLVRRIRTNTPLQALVTLNDPVYLEAAIQLARRLSEMSPSPREQIATGYQEIMVREITPQKLRVLETLYDDALVEFEGDPEAAGKLVQQEGATADLAAMTVVANALLNLDEFLTKE